MSRTPYLTQLLNRVEAMLDCGAATQDELATFLKVAQPRISEYVKGRIYAPKGETALMLLGWAAEKTLEISAAGKAAEKAYREAYERACQRHPVSLPTKSK